MNVLNTTKLYILNGYDDKFYIMLSIFMGHDTLNGALQTCTPAVVCRVLTTGL